MRSTIKTLAIGLSLAIGASAGLPTVAKADGELTPSIDLQEASAEAMETSEVMTETDAMAETEETSSTIVDIAASDDTFSTLVAAVTAADLVETLSGEGPFTVFAPTNEAFAALPDGVLEALLLPENKPMLVKILTYHVVSGNVASTDLVAGAVPTVEGSDIMVSLGDSVTVNNATVILADVEASNGVIHVIDTVILPPDLMSSLNSHNASL
jgi:uncharacterized surface protein with fasciclin (FAS1) repeats